MSEQEHTAAPILTGISAIGVILTLFGIGADICELVEEDDWEDEYEHIARPVSLPGGGTFISPIEPHISRDSLLAIMRSTGYVQFHECARTQSNEVMTWEVHPECTLFRVSLDHGIVTTYSAPRCDEVAAHSRQHFMRLLESQGCTLVGTQSGRDTIDMEVAIDMHTP